MGIPLEIIVGAAWHFFYLYASIGLSYEETPPYCVLFGLGTWQKNSPIGDRRRSLFVMDGLIDCFACMCTEGNFLQRWKWHNTYRASKSSEGEEEDDEGAVYYCTWPSCGLQFGGWKEDHVTYERREGKCVHGGSPLTQRMHAYISKFHYSCRPHFIYVFWPLLPSDSGYLPYQATHQLHLPLGQLPSPSGSTSLLSGQGRVRLTVAVLHLLLFLIPHIYMRAYVNVLTRHVPRFPPEMVR